MIRTNLSTRPFYNERAVRGWLAAIAVVIVVATTYNVARIIRYSNSDTVLRTQASSDEARTADLRIRAARLRASVDTKEIDNASIEARQANDLIDRRTFSWTELFNRFETTLPDNVRIAAVKPRVDPKRGFLLTITVLAKSVEDVNRFMDNLEDTGAFDGVSATQERFDDQGLLNAQLEARYVPGAAKK
jgi:Tfp pilus assembly protein PilN